MADYININEHSKKGKLAITSKVFEQLVNETISSMEGVKTSSIKRKGFQLISPVFVKIQKGIAHVQVAINLKKELNIQEFISRIQNEISNTIISYTDQVPFDVQIKVESLI